MTIQNQKEKLPKKQLALSLDHAASFAPADFILSQCNNVAHALINSHEQFVFLCGPKASGKTHLAHIFGGKIMSAASLNGTKNSEEIFSEDQKLVIEDLQDLEHEESLFHLINFAKEKNFALLITSEKNLNEFNFEYPDLSSRLKAFMIAHLDEPDDDLLAAYIMKNFSDKQLSLSPDVIKFIIARAERSFAFIQSLINELDKKSLEEKRKITIPLVKEILD